MVLNNPEVKLLFVCLKRGFNIDKFTRSRISSPNQWIKLYIYPNYFRTVTRKDLGVQTHQYLMTLCTVLLQNPEDFNLHSYNWLKHLYWIYSPAGQQTGQIPGKHSKMSNTFSSLVLSSTFFFHFLLLLGFDRHFSRSSW